MNSLEFDSTMKRILQEINNGNADKIISLLTHSEKRCLKQCYDDGYIEGIHVQKMASGKIVVECTSRIEVTRKGLNFMDHNLKDATQNVTNFNIQNANAPFAATMNAETVSSNIQITNGVNLDDLRDLIKSKPAIDQAQLSELLRLLQDAADSDAPVHKGFLRQFSDLIKKHTDLITPLGVAFVQMFAGGR